MHYKTQQQYRKKDPKALANITVTQFHSPFSMRSKYSTLKSMQIVRLCYSVSHFFLQIVTEQSTGCVNQAWLDILTVDPHFVLTDPDD